MSEKFSLKWNDYQANWSKSLSNLRTQTDFADVTLVTDDKVKFSAHKILLSSCSSTFNFILKENNHANPLIYLSGVSSANLGFILDYIYNGEINLYQEQLDSFLESSQKLEIEGLLVGKEDGERMHSEENMEMKDKSEYQPNEDSNLETMNSTASVKTIRAQLGDFKRMDGSSITPEDMKINIENLYQKTDGVWACKTCGFTNPKRFNIKRHVEIHIDGLLYTCDLCHKEFRSKNVLDNHISCVHRK